MSVSWLRKRASLLALVSIGVLFMAVCIPTVAQARALAGPAVKGNNFLRIDPNNSTHLLFQGKQIVLKGANLEGYFNNTDSIWLNFNLNTLDGLLAQAQNAGVNTIRLTFPDGGSTNRSTFWNATHLGYLDSLLDRMNARGMGAIVTLFNRHPYATANVNDDHNWISRIMNYTSGATGMQLKNDPRILMWDIANEPSLSNTGPVMGWLQNMRGYIASLSPSQLVTIGWDNQYSASIAANYDASDPNARAIRSSDVVSLHCYSRYSGDWATMSGGGNADGVNYRNQTFCGGSLHLVKNLFPNHPVLLEEFGWENAPGSGENGSAPWGSDGFNSYAFPRNDVCVSDIFNQVLNTAVPSQDSVGAVMWDLQDYPTDNFGLLDRNGNPKVPGVPNGQSCNPLNYQGMNYQGANYDNPSRFPIPGTAGYTLFSNWNDNNLVRPFRLEAYRLYNGATGEHFYTNDPDEVASLVNSGWSLEKTHAWAVARAPGNGLIPLYRCYVGFAVKHLYTTDANCEGQTYESVFGYVAASPGGNGSPTQGMTALYRLMRPNPFDHFYTASASESNDAQSIYGYTLEKIQCYVWP